MNLSIEKHEKANGDVQTDVTNKYFFPLKVDFSGGYYCGVWDDYCIYDGKFALKYSDQIKEEFDYYTESEMVGYFEDYHSASDKITSIKWGFEEKDGTLYGVVTVKAKMPLTDREENELVEWISAQNSDGIGEGFEQCEIPVDNAISSHIYVHFWNDGEDYRIWRENEEIDTKKCANNAEMTIRELREKHGMTQKQMSDVLGIPKRTIESWDEGKRNPPEYVLRLIEFRLDAESK